MLSTVSNSDPPVQFLFLDGDVFVELVPFKSLVVYIWDVCDISVHLFIWGLFFPLHMVGDN